MPAVTDREIGRRIAGERECAGVSRAQLADWLDIDVSVMGRIERGDVACTVGRLTKIARLLGAPPARGAPSCLGAPQ